MLNLNERFLQYKKTGRWQYYLECPHCNCEAVDDTKEFPLVCLNCHEEFSEDDVCPECEKLVKGSCYLCKMD